MSPERITIIANGEEKHLTSPCSVAGFLRSCGWQPTQVVVEYNGNVLPRPQLETAPLQNGDQLEIIQPVAGG